MRICWMANMPSKYKVDFLDKLGEKCELTVLFERYNATGVRKTWEEGRGYNFRYYFSNCINIGRESSLTFDFLKYINRKRYDLYVISSYSSPAQMLAIIKLKLLKIPFMIVADGGVIKDEKKIMYFLKRFFISSAEYWIGTGNETLNYFLHYNAKRENIFSAPFTSMYKDEILNSPINTVQKKLYRKELGLSKCNVIIGVGQFIYRKGFDFLLETWCDLNDSLHLVLVGSGEEEANYRSYIKEKKLKNVTIINQKSKVELLKYYYASDLFILPTREDIWGLVINEAMACGLPVITTNRCVAGLELINNAENGFIVPVDDKLVLKECILKVMSNEELRECMAKNNLKKIQKYTLEEMAEVYFDIFQKILSRREKNA